MVVVPDVKGLTGVQVNKSIINSGLNLAINGLVDIDKIESDASLIAKGQTPEAGESVPVGTVVTVDFISTGYGD
jgi:beta-lactam-binding protein with PASTA domain